MNHKNKVKMPTKSTLKSRKSTINNAFVYSIMPWKKITEEEYEKICRDLNIKENQCTYCLKENVATTMDHLNCLVSGTIPTGYYTEKNNLVPCCSSCNSSKGNKKFEEWYTEEKSEKLGLSKKEIQKRRKIICEYMEKNPANRLDLESILGKKDYKKYIQIKKKLGEKIEECEKFCQELSLKIQNEIEGEN